MGDGANFVLLIAHLVTVVSALAVTFHPNILHASVALLFTFLGVAVLFLFAGADFLAGAQVVVYVGGVTILILFAIMLTQWLYHVRLKDHRWKMLTLLAVLFLALVPYLRRALNELGSTVPDLGAEKLTAFTAAPKTHGIGEALLGTYLLPFEAITVLLLGALVGAVWLARPNATKE